MAIACDITCDELIVKKTLGEGSFGKVTLVALIADPETHYAMKVVSKGSGAEVERKILNLVCNPFIVGMRHSIDVDELEQVALLLDYCPAGTLHKHMRRCGGRFDEELAMFYLAEVILAIEYLHGIQVIYRDLKPENVLLDACGHTKLTDFGLCIMGIADNSSATDVCGTLEYCAPEMCDLMEEGKGGHGRALDWWTVGIFAFQLMTGRTPFVTRKGNHETCMRRIRTSPINMPSSISENARQFIRDLTVKEKEDRLGAGEGDGQDVRSHALFKDLDWTAVYHRQRSPPFRPELEGPDDLKYLYSDLEKHKKGEASAGLMSCLADCLMGLLLCGRGSSSAAPAVALATPGWGLPPAGPGARTPDLAENLRKRATSRASMQSTAASSRC